MRLGYCLKIDAYTLYGDFSDLCAVILLAAALVLILKNFGFKGAPVIVCILMCSSATLAVSYISGVGEELSELLYYDGEEYVSAVLKIVGVGYLSGVTRDVCLEIGEGGIAKCVCIAARLELTVIAMPFIRDIFLFAKEFIG